MTSHVISSSHVFKEARQNNAKLWIEYFFSLSKNLTAKDKAEEGRAYRLLEQLFKAGFVINEKQMIRGDGFPQQIWPEIGVSRDNEPAVRITSNRSFVEMTLIDYLEFKLDLHQPSALILRTTNAAKEAVPCSSSGSSNLGQVSSLIIGAPYPVRPIFSEPRMPQSSSSSHPVEPESYSCCSNGRSHSDSNLKPYHLLSKSNADSQPIFASLIASKTIFCKPSTVAAIKQATAKDKTDPSIQKALDLFNQSIYYETFDGKEVVMKKGKIMAVEEGIHFYPECEDLPGYYTLDDGTISLDGVRNVKCMIPLNSREKILKVIERLGCALLEERL